MKKLGVAPGIAKQGPLSGSAAGHCTHWYANVIGNDPDHEPAVAETKSPTIGTVSPLGSEMLGGAVFAGGLTTPACVTTPVAFDGDDAVEPAAFDAVTTTRSLWPTSAPTTAYVEAVAPPMSAQPLPAESQRRH